MVLHFLNDLGIIPNKGTSMEKNINLSQGQDFLYYNRVYESEEEKNADKLQKTHIDSIADIREDTSIVEPMDNKNLRLSILESKFNKKLTEYTSIHSLFIEEFVKRKKELKLVEKYLNKNVKVKDTDQYFYINKYGYLREYREDSWLYRSGTCSSEVLELTLSELTDLMKNTTINMSKNVPCNVTGVNVRNTKTGHKAWVDGQDIKHEYDNSFLPDEKNLCPIKEDEVINLTEQEYDGIPNSNKLISGDVCNIYDINIDLWKSLIKLNDELISLARQINRDVSSITYKNLNNLEVNKVKDIQLNINNFTSSLDLNKLSDKDLNETINDEGDKTIDGQNVTTKLNMDSTRFNYVLAATFFLILLVSLFFAVFGNITYVSYSILLIFSIMLAIVLVQKLLRSNLINNITRFFNYILMKIFN